MLVSLVSIGGSCYTRVSSPFSMNSFHAVWVTDTPQCIISARCPVLMNEFANQSTVRLVDSERPPPKNLRSLDSQNVSTKC